MYEKSCTLIAAVVLVVGLFIGYTIGQNTTCFNFFGAKSCVTSIR